MKVGPFNRVELVVREDEIDDAVKQFNELLGLNLPRATRHRGRTGALRHGLRRIHRIRRP